MTPPDRQIPPVYHRRIGDVIVTALSDGVIARTHEMMNDVPEEEARHLLGAAFRDRFMLSVNAFLIHAGDRVALIDTGSGDYLGPEAGHLPGALAAAGVTPDDIETVLLTHMHPDHSAGLTDRETGSPLFPSAELVVHEAEPAHWYDDAAMARGSDREKALMFQQAREQCAPYRDRTRIFNEGEVFPGVTAIPSPGHTPGHTAFLVNSGDESLLIWGDTVHMPEVQVPRPDVTMVVDVDPPAAAASRRRIFDMAASDRLLVTGMHLHYPGFGHVAKGKAGAEAEYRFVPEPWRQDL